MSRALTTDKHSLEPLGNSHARAPRADWRDMRADEHFVQFYETDEFLLDSLGGFIGEGLRADETCIAIAKPTNLENLTLHLQQRGFDMAAAIESGQYVALDATQALTRFVVDGKLDLSRFAEISSNIITSATQNGRPLRIFGEMVALLWADGNQNAAIELEELWDQLQRTHKFSLFCAYPLRDCCGNALAEPMAQVCHKHSRVLPAESYNALENADDRLRAITLLQQQARSLEAEVAEREKAEAALREALERERAARAEVENLHRMKDDFLATLSHELRTPLHSILGWTQLLTTSPIDDPISRQGLEVIERNVKSQALLVNDLLDASRIVTGKMSVDLSPQSLPVIIGAALSVAQVAAAEKQIEIVTDFQADCHISGDPYRLQQVLGILLQNAIKFSYTGQQVLLRLEEVDSRARLSIIDNGIGIEPEYLPQLFNRFSQADGTATRKHGGLGLGLSIARHLVELHGGTITATSQGENLGATFVIELPLLEFWTELSS